MQPDELQTFIRFTISQLSPQNGQADFEKVCLYFAKARIHQNILPATGPVQAGGDQGRDFETFHTYLSETTIAHNTYIGNFSGRPVVFACSMEKDPTKKNGKITSDLKTITGVGTNIDRVYFFSGQDIPVAARHKAIDDAKRTYKVKLEIIDANALSQHLAEPDLFWVATQFLKVPANVYPEKTGDGWYTTLFAEYSKRKKPIRTYEEFFEVKEAIRSIYKSKTEKSDLPFWYALLDELIANISFGSMVRDAIYERFVTALVGTEFVEGQEGNIERYFKDFDQHITTAELEDANHLLSFSVNAYFGGRINLEKSFLDGIADRMEKLIDGMLSVAITDDNRCALLEIKASFMLNDRRGEIDYRKNFNAYINGLNQLIAKLPGAHFFPFERFADRLNKNLKTLMTVADDIAPLEKVVEKADQILADKGAKTILAGKLRDRGVMYFKAGETGKAIRIFHDLKLKWFNKETMAGVILTCNFLGKAYKRQGLFFAAKYYHLVAAYLAQKDKDTAYSDKLTQSLSEAAECDYVTGAWVSYLNISEIHLQTHGLATKDFDLYDHDDTIQLLYYPAVILKIAKELIPGAEQLLKEAVPVYNELSEDMDEIGKRFVSKRDDRTLKESAEEEISGIPFNDIDGKRIISFNACGCNWIFTLNNTYRNNSIIEEYLTVFQIVLQDLADEDLHLLPGDVNINIRIAENGKFGLQEQREDQNTIEITLAPFLGKTPEQRHKYTFDLLVYAQMLLFLRSALSTKDYKTKVDSKLKSSQLLEKVSFGQAYTVVYGEFYRREVFEKILKAKVANPFYSGRPKLRDNQTLPWLNFLSPLFDEKRELETIHNRVKWFTNTVAVTLPAIKSSGHFRKLIEDLRSDGWLDWHILHVIANKVVSKKVFTEKKYRTVEDYQKLFWEGMQRNETAWYTEIKAEEFQVEDFKKHLEVLLPMSVLSNFGLDDQPRIHDAPGYLQLLRHRFNFFETGKEIILLD